MNSSGGRGRLACEGWARRAEGRRWHQVETLRRPGMPGLVAAPLCGAPLILSAELMDYRWRPPSSSWCRQPACMAPVEP